MLNVHFTDQDRMTSETAKILTTFFLAGEFTATTMGATIANTFIDDGYIVVGEIDGMKSILDITHKGELFLELHKERIQERLLYITPMAIQVLPSDWIDKVIVGDEHA